MTQTVLDNVKAALLSVSNNVFHYSGVGASCPYIVWAEESDDDIYSGDVPEYTTTNGTIDFFTKNENDPLVERIQDSLMASGIIYTLISVLYEDTTKIIHYEWEWEAS